MKNIRSVLVNRIRMQGMIVFDWHQRYGEARSELAGMVQQGKIKTRESVADGIASAPQAFIGLLKGRNFGKQLVKLA
jgi:NADPH-dependent curcumin reductase CurA